MKDRISLNPILRARLFLSLVLFLGISLFGPKTLARECFTPIAKILRPKLHQVVLDDLKAKYQTFDHVVRQENERFIEFVKNHNRQRSVLFYHFENSVLKDLNDKVFLDKNVSQALTIKYQKILLEEIQKNHFLKKNILHKYADYKTIRFVFKSKRNGNHFKKQLELAEKEALNKFKEFLSHNDLNDYLQKRLTRTKVKDVDDWFLSSLSDDVTFSALKARYFRIHPKPDVRDPKIESEIIKEYYLSLRQDFLSLEQELIDFYKAKDGQFHDLLLDQSNGQEVLSFEILKVFRKLDDSQASFEQAQLEILNLAGFVIKKDFFKKHIRLIQMLNEFSPPVYQPFTRAVEFSKAGKGIISVDISNLGLEGMFSLYQSLKRPMKPEDLFENIFESYWPTHHRLLDIYRPTAHSVIRGSGLQYVHPIESGDDMLFFFKRNIEEGSLERIVDNLNGTDIPSKLRIVEMPTRFLDSMRGIPEIRMSRYISRAEQLEKDLRKNLRSSISLESVRRTSISIKVMPYSDKKATFVIYIKNPEKALSRGDIRSQLRNIKSLNSNIEIEIL